MEALHTSLRTSNASGRPRARMVRSERGVSLGPVSGVGGFKFVGIDLHIGSSDAADGFEPAHAFGDRPVHEPVERRHRRPVVQKGSIPDHDGFPGLVSDDDFESRARHPSEEPCDVDTIPFTFW